MTLYRTNVIKELTMKFTLEKSIQILHNLDRILQVMAKQLHKRLRLDH
jgi:hypothetical protein